MEPQILVALIGALAVVVSTLISVPISVLISRSGSRRDLLARNRDLFGAQLVQQRFEHYPELYPHLSDFSKKLRKIPKGRNDSPISVDEFRETRDYVFDWDSTHSYLMSKKCAVLWSKYYSMLESYCAKDDQVLATELNNADICNKISIDSGSIELALRSDLGVFDVEFVSMNRFYSDWQDLMVGSWKTRLYLLLNQMMKWTPWIRDRKHKMFGSRFSIQWLNK